MDDLSKQATCGHIHDQSLEEMIRQYPLCVVERLPDAKDDRTVVEVSYTVRVKPSGDASDIDVSTSLVGYYDESRNAISNFMSDKKRDHDDLLDCKSTGVFESEFVARVQTKLR